MDKIKANQLLVYLMGMEVEGINIESFIDNGKSAAVYRGKKGDTLYAIKIFDDELVERYGVDVQQQRIDLELSLKDHKIDNLVKILGGGQILINKIAHFYLIMEYIEGMNLKNYIGSNIITIDFIIKVINILIEVTEKLLKNNPPLAHRDIKPENIMISENKDVILMDLGVLKIIGAPSMSDVEQKQFLGTLRYAPPEFLTRDEDNTLEGWKAVNVYQTGAVLHDLIMKKELFAGIEPYANLVITIKEDMPKIISSNFHPDLIQMARNMLQKDWKKRLELSSIDIIKKTLNECLVPQKEPANLYNDIKTSALTIQVELEEIANISRSLKEKSEIRSSIHNNIWHIIDDCFEALKTNDIIKAIGQSAKFKLHETVKKRSNASSYMIYQIDGKFDYGFARPVFILFKVENDEKSYCQICVIGIIPDLFCTKNLKEPDKLLSDIFSNSRMKYPPLHSQISKPPEYEIPFSCVFNGIIELEDKSLHDMIDKTIASILAKAIQRMEPEIKRELESRKKALGASSRVSFSFSISSGSIFINL
jgi:serine/threonine protein kinase